MRTTAEPTQALADLDEPLVHLAGPAQGGWPAVFYHAPPAGTSSSSGQSGS